MLATFPMMPERRSPCPVLPATLRSRYCYFSWCLPVWVVASRLPYLNHFDSMGKDGPLYIGALALDEHYDVPMPGNIGYVLLGKLASALSRTP